MQIDTLRAGSLDRLMLHYRLMGIKYIMSLCYLMLFGTIK